RVWLSRAGAGAGGAAGGVAQRASVGVVPHGAPVPVAAQSAAGQFLGLVGVVQQLVGQAAVVAVAEHLGGLRGGEQVTGMAGAVHGGQLRGALGEVVGVEGVDVGLPPPVPAVGVGVGLGGKAGLGALEVPVVHGRWADAGVFGDASPVELAASLPH